LTMFLFLLPMVAQVTSTCNMEDEGWQEVHRSTIYDFDLDTTPLEIKTNSEARGDGMDEKMSVHFFDDQYQTIGGIAIRFRSIMQYQIFYCNGDHEWVDFPASLSSTDKHKVWRFTLDKSSGVRFKVHCNDVEVINVLISPSECEGAYRSIGEEWNDRYWSTKVVKINIDDMQDYSASDYFRPYTGVPHPDETEELKKKLEEAEKMIAELKSDLKEEKDKLEAAEKMIKELEEENEKVRCPGKGVFTVPSSVVGKKIKKKDLRKWKKQGLKDMLRFLGPFKGVKITKKLANYIECHMTVN